jgi:UDP-N-acetylglucosamine--N-acetylmuramyl-(pentapeptide) pyrophosphoryl-undecaprenol N-acetylglucosamine transferase
MAMAEKTVVIAAGGTGGHLFPAAAFAEEMRKRGWRIVLITDERGRRYAEKFPADEMHGVAASTIQGFNPVRAAKGALSIWKGIGEAKALLTRLQPRLVAGFGGYPSLPALWAARDQKRPILIHEQNAVLGRVNRIFAGDAAAIACGFERLDRLPAAAAGRKYMVGNPVRPPIVAARETPYPALPAGGPIHVLVIGGSQGARILGDVIPAAISQLSGELRGRLRVTQQTREEQVGEVKRAYAAAGVQADIAPFFSDIGPRIAAAHLVIARAGASTVTELAAVGRPAILVPLAIAADDHQSANAEGLALVAAADILAEPAFTETALSALLAKRLGDPHGLAVRASQAKASGRTDAAQALADLAEQTAA